MKKILDLKSTPLKDITATQLQRVSSSAAVPLANDMKGVDLYKRKPKLTAPPDKQKIS